MCLKQRSCRWRRRSPRTRVAIVPLPSVTRVGWTQHSKGPQIIGACALLQLLMGNIGRPGGGIMSLRGHASIQGSTDIPTLYDILPGYLAMPNTFDDHATLQGYLKEETPKTGYWNNLPKYMISLLKAYYGEQATAENDYCYDFLPKISSDYSMFPMFMAAKDGYLKGMFVMGQNPAVGGMNTGYMREGLANLDWLVVRDLFEIETATFWRDSPEVKSGKLDTCRSRPRSSSCRPRSWRRKTAHLPIRVA